MGIRAQQEENPGLSGEHLEITALFWLLYRWPNILTTKNIDVILEFAFFMRTMEARAIERYRVGILAESPFRYGIALSLSRRVADSRTVPTWRMDIPVREHFTWRCRHDLVLPEDSSTSLMLNNRSEDLAEAIIYGNSSFCLSLLASAFAPTDPKEKYHNLVSISFENGDNAVLQFLLSHGIGYPMRILWSPMNLNAAIFSTMKTYFTTRDIARLSEFEMLTELPLLSDEEITILEGLAAIECKFPVFLIRLLYGSYVAKCLETHIRTYGSYIDKYLETHMPGYLDRHVPEYLKTHIRTHGDPETQKLSIHHIVESIILELDENIYPRCFCVDSIKLGLFLNRTLTMTRKLDVITATLRRMLVQFSDPYGTTEEKVLFCIETTNQIDSMQHCLRKDKEKITSQSDLPLSIHKALVSSRLF